MKNKQNTKWFSLASIWFGGIVSVPALLIGSTLISSLRFSSSVLAGLIGFSIVVLLMSVISISAVEKQKNSVALASSSFGKKGAAILVGLVLGISTLGWFGVQSNIAGSSFSKILLDTAQINIPAWISSAFWGIIMMLTAVFGFKILKWLNYIAAPAITLLIFYGLYITFQTHSFQDILDYRPKNEMPFLQAIGLVIGFISVAIVISPDYNRFAASKKDAILGSLFGILPSALPLLAIGAILAITQGTYDIVEIFSKLGFPFLAMTVLILATWTSNVMNMYSSGLAFNTMFNLSEETRAKTTIIVGLVGIVLAALGILNHFIDFITLLTITVTPIAGILASDYFVSKDHSNPTTVDFNWKGIVAWVAGIIVMLLIESETKYILGIITSMLTYYLFARLIPTSKTPHTTFNNKAVEFPIKENYVFLSHCGVSPITKYGYEETSKILQDQLHRGALCFVDHYDFVLDDFKKNAAQLINASKEDIAFVKNTSEAFSMIANGYPFEKGDEIISFIDEYPANHYPWKLQENKGVKLKLIPRKRYETYEHYGYWSYEDLEKLISSKTKVIALSHVQFTSGYAADLEMIGKLCKEHRIDFIVDVAQSLGCLPIDVEKYNISALASSGWKWLLGPIGTGIFYTSPSFRDKLTTVVVGAETMVQYRDYLNHTWSPQKSAKKFEYSTSPIALANGLSQTIKKVHLKHSIDSIHKQVIELQDYFLSRLKNDQFKPLLFPQSNRSGILCLYHKDATQVVGLLADHKIICSVQGNMLRVAPHFYNTVEDMDQLVNYLNEVNID